MSPILYFKSRKPNIIAKMIIDNVFRKRLSNFENICNLFEDKDGIEIGGPSRFFSKIGFMPIYSLAFKIDGCNFSSQTTWEGNITEGETYHYTENKYGHQFICEGAEVSIISRRDYDFVLSCNNLEHIANPLKAIKNWLNLVKDNGTIVLVLPRKQSNFDHKRPVTEFAHILDDYNKNVGEDDLTHLEEILELHDLKYDSLAGTFENFKKRSINNYQNRCLHHHVYNMDLLLEMCCFLKLVPVVKVTLTSDYVIVANKG